MTTSSTGTVRGLVEPGFEAVHDAFARNFEKGREVGAAFCVHRHGRKVVDLSGGTFDREGTRPYDDQTLQLVFSSTKGATAVCANLLAQQGRLDLDAPVASYWPEFAQCGKEELPVRFLLSHQAGLPAVDATLTREEVWAWDPVADALAAQQPFWEPGTAHGYHAITYGYLVGEVVRRISSRSLGTFFSEEVARPLGLEFFIGLPAELERRVSPVISAPIGGDASDPAYTSTLLARALNLGGAVHGRDWMNQRGWHAAESPGATGITNAVSLSRLYAGLIGGLEGGPDTALLSPEQLERARTSLTFGPDVVFASAGLPMEQQIGLGFWRCGPAALFGGEGSFGHGGAGGSYGFADPENGLAVGYVMNKMCRDVIDPRPHRLIPAVYQAVGAEAKYF